MIELTLDELGKFNGSDGELAYVAYKGKIFDVTESPMWDDGDHAGMHEAGRDLTEDHEDAPHDEYVLDLPQVGTVKT